MKKILSFFMVVVLIMSMSVLPVFANANDPSYDLILKNVTGEQIVFTLVLKNSVGLNTFDLQIHYDTKLLKFKDYVYGDDFFMLCKLAEKNSDLLPMCAATEHSNGVIYYGIVFYDCLLSSAEYAELAKQYGEDVKINSENFRTIDFVFELKNLDIYNLEFSIDFMGSNLNEFQREEVELEVEVFDHMHDFSDGWIEVAKPTCRYTGTEKTVCKICKIEKTRKIDKLPHEYSKEYTIDSEPNCVLGGEKSRHCLNCDARTDVIELFSTHIYEDWYIVEEESSEKVVTIRSECRGTPMILNGCQMFSIKTFFIDEIVSEWTADRINPAAEGITVGAGMKAGYFLQFITEGLKLVDKDGNNVQNDSILTSGMQVVLSFEGFDYAFIPVIIKGDVDGDGKIAAADARVALRASVGLESLSDWQTKAANVENNEKIDAAAARLILRASVGLENSDAWIF